MSNPCKILCGSKKLSRSTKPYPIFAQSLTSNWLLSCKQARCIDQLRISCASARSAIATINTINRFQNSTRIPRYWYASSKLNICPSSAFLIPCARRMRLLILSSTVMTPSSICAYLVLIISFSPTSSGSRKSKANRNRSGDYSGTSKLTLQGITLS